MGMKKCLPLLTCLLLSVASADVYKWSDEDGNVHYSDRSPEEGMKQMELPKSVVYTPPRLPSTGSRSAARESPTAKYASLAISRPEMNETVHSNEGIVQIEYDLAPALKPGDKYRLLLDGKRIQDLTTQSSVSLHNVDRGSHTIVVQVMREGAVIIASKSVIFHLWKASSNDEDTGSAEKGDDSGDSGYEHDYSSSSSTYSGIPKDSSSFKAGDSSYGGKNPFKSSTSTYAPSYGSD